MKHRIVPRASVVLVAFGGCVLLALVFVRVPYVSLQQFASTGNVGELTGPMEVGQWFVSERPFLSGIIVQIATYGNRKNTEDVHLELRERPQGEPIRTAKESARRLHDHQRVTWSFTPVADARSKRFFVALWSPASRSGNAITLEYSAQNPYQDPGYSSLLIARTGKPRTESDALRALKPQADLTFGVVHSVSLGERVLILFRDAIRSFRSDPVRWLLALRFSAVAVLLGLLVAGFPGRFLRAFDKAQSVPYVLGALLILGFFLRLNFARHLRLTNDEGTALYDARTILERHLPGGDGILKAPVFAGSVAAGLALLGSDVTSGRLVSALAGTLTAIPLLRVLRVTGLSRRARLAGAGLWLLAPMPVVVSVYIHAQPLQQFIGLLALASAVAALPPPVETATSRRRLPPVLPRLFTGIFLGLAVGVRKTSVAFALPVVAIWLFSRTSWRERIRTAIVAAVGGLLTIGLLSTLEYRLYGGAGVRNFLGVDVAAINPDVTASAEERSSALIKGVLPIFREGLPILFLALLGIGGNLEGLARSRWPTAAGRWRARWFWTIPILLAWWGGEFLQRNERTEYLAYGLWPYWIVMIGTLILCALLPRGETGDPSAQPNVRQRLVLLAVAGSWFATAALLYASWIKFTANYLAEFLGPLVLLGIAGVAWVTTVPRPRRLVFPLVVCLTAWGTFTSLKSAHTFPHTGTFDLASVREAADIVRQNVPQDEPVLTAALVVPLLTGHHVPFDVAHPTHYAYGYIEPHVRNVYMVPADVMERFVLERVRWVVNERLTAFSYFREYPAIDRLVRETFDPLATIENLSNPITILHRRDSAAP